MHTFVHSTLLAGSLVLLAPAAFAQSALPPPPPAAPAPSPAPAAPDQPQAPAPGGTMHGMTSAFLGIGYGYGFSTGLGVGARFEWVFLPDGALKLRNGMHDEIGVEAGFDYFHAGYDAGTFGGEKVTWSYNEFTPVVGIVWNFWLTDKLALYPKIDLGYRIASWSESVGGSGSVASAS